MSYIVRFYQNAREEIPVKVFIATQNDQTKAKFLRLYELLRDYGPRLAYPHTKKLTKDIFELRIRGTTEIRILYTCKNGEYFLLHAFQKKTQKTPMKELKIAQSRLTEI